MSLILIRECLGEIRMTPKSALALEPVGGSDGEGVPGGSQASAVVGRFFLGQFVLLNRYPQLGSF